MRTPEEAEARAPRCKALLRQPLTADRAVQIALLNNRDLQAAYNALGLSEAAMVQASLPPNPTFSLERIAGGGALEIEAPHCRKHLAARDAAGARRNRCGSFPAGAVSGGVGNAAHRERSPPRILPRGRGARAGRAPRRRRARPARPRRELAKRLGETGAMNKLDQARNQAFYAEMVGAARHRAPARGSERERLVRALGLWGDDLDFKLPAQLPPLPARARALASIEMEAVRRRVDLQMARIEADVLAKSYGLTNATRFINLLDVAGIAKKQREDGETARERGFEVEFQIPLFDFGEVKVQAGRGNLPAGGQPADRESGQRPLGGARSLSGLSRRPTTSRAHYRREVLPLRKIISDETLLRYNAMQIDVFALLIEARQRITAINAAIEAERDFWLAETNLGAAVLGGGAGRSLRKPTLRRRAAESAGGH